MLSDLSQWYGPVRPDAETIDVTQWVKRNIWQQIQVFSAAAPCALGRFHPNAIGGHDPTGWGGRIPTQLFRSSKISKLGAREPTVTWAYERRLCHSSQWQTVIGSLAINGGLAPIVLKKTPLAEGKKY